MKLIWFPHNFRYPLSKIPITNKNNTEKFLKTLVNYIESVKKNASDVIISFKNLHALQMINRPLLRLFFSSNNNSPFLVQQIWSHYIVAKKLIDDRNDKWVSSTIRITPFKKYHASFYIILNAKIWIKIKKLDS